MKYLIKLSIILITIFSTSCANRMATNKLSSLNSESKTVQLTDNIKTPNADYFTAGEVTAAALFGIPSIFMKKRGVVNISHAENPEIYLKKEVAKILSKKHNLKKINPSKKVLNVKQSLKTKDLLEKYKEGDLVLDMNSRTYGGYYPGRINDFRTYYTVTMNLIERKTRESIYKSTCTYDKKENNDFTLKQIANDKQVITSIFEKAKVFCLDKFATEININ